MPRPILPRLTLTLTLFLLALQTAWAQDPPMEWGEVSREHLEMTHYAPDSNAAAVILADYGTTRFRFNGEVEFERHTRVKILTEAGYDEGTVSIPFYDEDDYERVRKIDGQTFVLGPGGEVQRHELDGDDIYEENVDDRGYKRMKFTLPALAPGAVVEYRYQIRVKNPYVLPEWNFQSDEPTLWSEYDVLIPNVLQYAHLLQATQPFHERTQEQRNSSLGASTQYRWVMKDVPALREEPFMTTAEDYRARVRFQLQRVAPQFSQGFTYYASWEELAKDLMDHDGFGREVGRHKEVRRRAEAVVQGLGDKSSDARIRALYDYVRTSLQWTGARGLGADRDLDDVLEGRTGSQPELALLLLSMLRDAGVEAHPVLVSTRDHGRLEPRYPFLRQFNGVLVYAVGEEQQYLLDPTDPQRPYSLLPTEMLNHSGLMLENETPKWIGIEPSSGLQRRTLVRGTLTADGALEATLEVTDHAYSALGRRAAIEEEGGAQPFVERSLLGHLPGAAVETPTVANVEIVEEPLKTNVSFAMPGYAQVAGDFLYVNPTVVGRQTENPLRRPEREYPVDLAIPRDLTYTLSLRLPNGYVVHEKPQNVQVVLPDKTGAFQRLISGQNGTLTMQMRLVLKKTVFPPEEYEAIRELYARLVETHAEQVVLKRATAATTSEAAGQSEDSQ